MTTKLPHSTHDGMLPVGTMEIPSFVLDDGRRVISGRGMTSAIGMKGRGQGVTRIVAHPTLKPFIDKGLSMAIETPIEFHGIANRKTQGYEADVLIDLCKAVIDARNAKMLRTPQEQRYAHAADAVVTAFAKTGITAVIDEVTGYEAIRDRHSLQKILDRYLKQEHAKWAKRFPDEFYKLIFDMRGWQWRGMSVNRPSVVGKYTNDIVWQRLAPDILKELERLNPKDELGRRRVRHHQFLTDSIGHPKLQEHLHAAMALMRASGKNWNNFMRSMNRAFPKLNTTLELPFEDENGTAQG